ncbi:protein FAM178B isoform X2 [Numida meleagris]|uniref:protein FAM178B isoform X2 n=1 Tax=Numida meleagris TaxID=8996 RepID=UPI000B3DE36B|nr:protein FAM178B isoform X2 [Numida meleagris]
MLRGASARRGRGRGLGLLRWYQIPLSSARVPRSGLFSFSFQYSLCSYQELRASKHLRVGRPFLPPPLGLVNPCPSASPSPPQPQSVASTEPASPQRPTEPHSACQGPCKARRPRASPRRSAQQGSATRSAHSVVQPSSATESKIVPPRAEDVAMTSSSDSEEELIPLKELLACSGRSSPAEHREVACLQPDPLANSLDALLLEKSPQESSDEDTQLLEEQRAFLSRFEVKLRTFPTTHPGEPIFHACPLPPPTLDTRGLQPRSVLEQNFLCASPAGQVAFVRDGYLNLLYRTMSACPLPVLHWLFQLMSTWPDRTNAFRTLWEMWMRSDDEPWCPTLQDIGQAFTCMGADLGALRCRQLLPPELCPVDTRLDPSRSLDGANLSAADTLALVTQLGDICKLLMVSVVACPCRYPDRARRELVTLLCFLSLDRSLRCQPLPDLWHLLHCLLEGIAAWKEQLPALCLSLCQLSRHHHSLLAVVQLLPDITDRERELRRRLSLCAMAQLLGKAPCTVLSLEAQEELPVLDQLLAQSWPESLQLPTRPGAPQDLEQETCYLCHSLLYLADVVVGTKRPQDEQRGHLQRLCTQLEQHFGSALREGMGQFYCSQLKNLAMVLYVKWHELLE